MMDEIHPILPMRHIEVAHWLRENNHAYGIVPSKLEGHYWAAIVPSPESGLWTAVDMDLLAEMASERRGEFIRSEAMAQEEALRQRIETGWKPEL